MPQKQPNRVPADPEGEPELRVPRPQMDQALAGRISQGQELLEKTAGLTEAAENGYMTQHEPAYVALRDEFYKWNAYNEQLLRMRFSTAKLADGYRQVAFVVPDDLLERLNGLTHDINGQLRKLDFIRQQLDLYKSVAPSDTRGGSVSARIGDKIFIVHGRDGDTKLQVAEFVERITGERPVILHEQADSGRTVIEKFEKHAAEVGFAIILLTADDEGNEKGATQLNPRARQNVVLEFGYFMGKLGRGRVVALHEAGVELPSDINGLLYTSLAGNWKFDLAGEIKAAGIDIDLAKALR